MFLFSFFKYCADSLATHWPFGWVRFYLFFFILLLFSGYGTYKAPVYIYMFVHTHTHNPFMHIVRSWFRSFRFSSVIYRFHRLCLSSVWCLGPVALPPYQIRYTAAAALSPNRENARCTTFACAAHTKNASTIVNSLAGLLLRYRHCIVVCCGCYLECARHTNQHGST